MPQLDWTTYPSQLFWLFVCFFLLWGLMTYIILPPIQKTIEGRRAHINALTSQAETLQMRANALEAKNAVELQAVRLHCEKQVTEVFQEKKEALKNARRDLESASQAHIREVKDKMEILKRDALREVQSLIPELREDILAHFQDLHHPKRKKANK